MIELQLTRPEGVAVLSILVPRRGELLQPRLSPRDGVAQSYA
jgi:hypothetical protein